ncbi:unnamed protein product [Staurois parvus]|uniref:Secreted protein n=1 Tax=Staurois parvus TaxID=386267 RepID=A0ABN9FRQ2_9NEOB|nr:unnamed protein product [Staurois parvus]
MLCQAPNLSWAPVPPLMLLPGPECVMGPGTASHCCCLHRTLCHVSLSGLLTLWWVPFCHRVLVWPPFCCCLHRHCGNHTLVLAPDCPIECSVR